MKTSVAIYANAALSPQQARELAEQLTRAAAQVEGQPTYREHLQHRVDGAIERLGKTMVGLERSPQAAHDYSEGYNDGLWSGRYDAFVESRDLYDLSTGQLILAGPDSATRGADA